MNLSIKHCDQTNRQQIEMLSVFGSQESFIELNSDSLKEADQFHFWQPVGLYDDENLVGFAMYGKCPDGEVWLDRFMIASQFQGKGYGKKFLKLIIDKIVSEYHCDEVYLSYTYENFSIAHFYQSVGFSATGERDPNGEIIMVLILK